MSIRACVADPEQRDMWWQGDLVGSGRVHITREGFLKEGVPELDNEG